MGAVAGALAGAQWRLGAILETLSHRLTSWHPAFVGTYPKDLIDLAEAL